LNYNVNAKISQALVELDRRSSRPNDHGGQEWVRTPL